MYRATLSACVRSGFRKCHNPVHVPTLPPSPKSSMVSLLKREEVLWELNHCQMAAALIVIRLPLIYEYFTRGLQHSRKAQGAAQGAASPNYPAQVLSAPGQVRRRLKPTKWTSSIFVADPWRWRIENWDCELPGATNAKEVKESEQPQVVCLYKPSLRFRTSTCTSTVRWPTPAHYPSPVLSASTTLRLYLDEPYATNQFI